jgi:glyoxylase-like metal-dependent hydrolase (beta-lactamase superfamily II)
MGVSPAAQAQRRIELGGVSVTLLRIGTFRSDAGTIFGPVPRTSWEPMVRNEIDDASRLLQALNLLVVTTPERRMLLETGLLPAGERSSDASIDALSAREGLTAVGIDPASIELVVPSHLHRDHAGGLADTSGASAFPRATVVAPQREIDAVASSSLRARAAYDTATLRALFAAKEPLAFERASEPDARVELRLLGGHTPGSQATIVRGGERTLLFLGDLFMRPWQSNPRWVTAYDDEAWVSVDAKTSIFTEAAAGEWLVAMSHEVAAPLGRLVADGDRFRFIAE